MDNYHVSIYTDGSVKGNPGIGGWAAVLIPAGNPEKVRLITGVGSQNTTNNRMESRAFLESLRCLEKPQMVFVYTDSQYVINGVNRIIANKELLGTHTDIWKEAEEIIKGLLSFRIGHVKAHHETTPPMNKLVDKYAKIMARRMLKPMDIYVRTQKAIKEGKAYQG